MNEVVRPTEETEHSSPLPEAQYYNFGSFVVGRELMSFDFEDKNSGFKLKKGEEILGIHMPVPDDGHSISLRMVRNSLERLGKYLYTAKEYPNMPDIVQDLNPRNFNAIVGVTYERLASASRVVGFSISDAPSLDIRHQDAIEKDYLARAGVTGRPMGKITVCYQAVDDFLERYAQDMIEADRQFKTMIQFMDEWIIA